MGKLLKSTNLPLVIRRVGIGLLLLSLFLSGPLQEAKGDTQEDQRSRSTALYLYNFLLFVDWPEGGKNQGETLTLCILGDELVADALKPMEGKSIKGKRLIIRPLLDLNGIESCHALFLSATRGDLIPDLIKRVQGLSVLTLSDAKGFAREGGMVCFTRILDSEAEGKKRFQINLKAVEKAGLKIRSRLLRLAEIIP